MVGGTKVCSSIVAEKGFAGFIVLSGVLFCWYTQVDIATL